MAKRKFWERGITAGLPFTLQRTFLSQNAGIEMRNFQKYAPLLLQKRERVVSADMRFKRVASTSGVRTHRKNERFSLAADTPILIFGEAPNPWFLSWRYFLGFSGKPFISMVLAIRTVLQCTYEVSIDYVILEQIRQFCPEIKHRSHFATPMFSSVSIFASLNFQTISIVSVS